MINEGEKNQEFKMDEKKIQEKVIFSLNYNQIKLYKQPRKSKWMRKKIQEKTNLRSI